MFSITNTCRRKWLKCIFFVCLLLVTSAFVSPNRHKVEGKPYRRYINLCIPNKHLTGLFHQVRLSKKFKYISYKSCLNKPLHSVQTHLLTLLWIEKVENCSLEVILGESLCDHKSQYSLENHRSISLIPAFSSADPRTSYAPLHHSLTSFITHPHFPSWKENFRLCLCPRCLPMQIHEPTLLISGKDMPLFIWNLRPC